MLILNDILDFSKIEAGKLDIEHIVFNPCAVVTETLKTIEVRTLKKGLSLNWEAPKDFPKQMMGDPGRIRQVLTNLCDNAIKFTQSGGVTVTMRLTQSGDQGYEVELSVRDTGVGIPQSKQQLIFAAFSQADNSTTRQFGGTGLGLTISSKLVELMGGRIWVDSSEGAGSTFHFTVRLGIAPAEVAPAPSSKAAQPQASRALKVLLVEDHAINQLLATSLLKKWGHTVTLARDGQEAVDIFPSGTWDVVLMDMQMPIMGGLEATNLIRALESADRRIPIIAVTANAMEADREACIAAGMNDFLTKPINSAILQAMLMAHCKN
jgi:CheY-like chemotaxis protein